MKCNRWRCGCVLYSMCTCLPFFIIPIKLISLNNAYLVFYSNHGLNNWPFIYRHISMVWIPDYSHFQIPTDLKIYNILVLSTNFLLKNKFLYVLEKTFIPCKLECKYWNEAIDRNRKWNWNLWKTFLHSSKQVDMT